MSPEQEELLKRSVQLSEQNHDILRSIQRSMRLSRIMSILYWVFIIGSAVGAYYLVQPYVEAVTGAYGGTRTSFVDTFKGAIDSFKQGNK